MNSCFNGRKGKVYCIISWPAIKSGYTTISQGVGDCVGKLGNASTSPAKPNILGSTLLLCIWWDQQRAVYYEQLKTIQTITGDCYRLQSMFLSRTLKKKGPWYEQRHDKSLLLYDNAWPHVAKRVKTNIEMLKFYVLLTAIFTRNCPALWSLVPIDGTWPGWKVLLFLWRCQKMGRLVVSLKRRVIFPT